MLKSSRNRLGASSRGPSTGKRPEPAPVKNFSCNSCNRDVEQKKVFRVTYKNIVISDYVRVKEESKPVVSPRSPRPHSSPRSDERPILSPRAKGKVCASIKRRPESSVPMKVHEVVNWIPDLIQRAEESLQRGDYVREDDLKQRWTNCVVDLDFLQRELPVCEDCCVAITDRVFNYTSSDDMLQFVLRRKEVKKDKPAPPKKPAVRLAPKPAAPPPEPVPTKKPSVPRFRSQKSSRDSGSSRTTDSFFVTGL